MNDPSTTASVGREITGLSALQLSRSIQAREVSCAEVMRAYLTQIEVLNPHVNAVRGPKFSPRINIVEPKRLTREV